jgi:hypothetical protein
MSEEIALAIADLETAKELWAALAAVTQENTNLRTLLGVLQQRNAHAERVVQAIQAGRIAGRCALCGELREHTASCVLGHYEAAVKAQRIT